MDIQQVVITIYSAVIGACLGSFLNVVAWRIPRGESIVSPPSHCPKCNHRIKAIENIPILSYIFLRGKCSSCKEKIAPTYCIIEFITMVVFGVAAYKFGSGTELFTYLTAFLFLIAIALIDYNTMDVYLFMPIAATLLITALNITKFISEGDMQILINEVFGIIGIVTLLILLRLIYKDKLGEGDIYIFLIVASSLPPYFIIISILLTSLIGIAVMSYLIFTKKITKDTPFPFGPFIAVGYILTVLMFI
ncbi:prepilin peptidase [Clostridium tertium]|uniref:prepilin peptidase n=1 Tax=Clostridium tertium TaxID=1559 RepID=UPI0023B235E6|nr:A24 family peptidase [Clostridium tertium]